MDRIFEETSYGRLALRKLGPVSDNFILYYAGWVGDSVHRDIMKVQGAEFRAAKSGPRKGEVCILVKGTERAVYLTAEEVQQTNLN